MFEIERLSVRVLERNDAALLAKWLSNPTVLQYYEGRDHPFDIDKVKKVFFDKETDVNRCIIEFKGVAIGYIQYYQLDKETQLLYGYPIVAPVTIYGIDQFIGEVNYWDQGIGQLLIRSMVKFLMKHKQANKIVMDPQTWNLRALRCYEKCGFRKIKLLSNHELHEGKYRDCWLIEFTKDASIS